MDKARILIVEDESLIALEIETRLQKYGYEICGKAMSSEDAISIALNQKPDLILMDVMIKGKLDGIQTAEEINKHKSIPVIYLTAFVDQKTLDRAKETTPFGYLTKPIQERDLRSTIEMALHKSRIENELKVTKNWLQITLASIGDGVIVTDSFGKINFMNSIAEKMTGWKIENAVGLDLAQIFNIVNETTGEKIDNPVNIVLHTGEIVHLSNHTILISKSGERLSILDSAAPIKDEKNNIQGVVLVFHDNTERKKAQQAFVHESNFRKLIIDFAAEGIFAVAGLNRFPDVTFTVWNDQMIEITGYTLDEINKIGISNLPFYSEMSESVSQLIDMLMKFGMVTGLEFNFVEKSGVQKTLSVSSSIIKQENGNDLIVGLISDLSEKKKVELKIKESEENFRTLAENTPVGIFIHRGQEIIFANKSACEQLGYDLEELKRMKYWELVHPDYLEQVKEIVNSRLSDSASPKTHEIKMITKSGANKWVEITATKTIYGGTPALLGIAIDITERKLVEEKVLLFAHAIRNIFDCVTITDLDNNLLFVNEAFEKTYGYSSSEVLGKHISIVAAYPNERIEDIRLETIKDGWTGELLNRKKDGTIFPIALTTSTIYDYNNNPVGLVGVTTDISERKIAEEKIKQSEKDYRRLFETAQDAIIIFKPEHEIVLDVNQQACEMYGLPKEKFIGISLEDFSLNTKVGKTHVQNTLQEGIRYQFEITQRKPNGSLIDLEISASVIEYKNQQAILSINRDITERKQNEKALKQSEEKYRNLFETMTQGVIYQSANGDFLSANYAAENLLGLSFEQLKKLSKSIPDWKVLKEDGSYYANDEYPAIEALKTGLPVKGKVLGVYNKKLGEYKWLLVDAIPEFQPGSDKPYQVFTTFSDITQIRRAEKIQQSFFRISEASSSAATIESLFGSIHSIVRELIPAENFFIALYDNKTNIVSFPYFVDEKDPHPVPRKLNKGLTDYVIRENKSLSLSKENFEDFKKKNNLVLIGSISSHWLGVPLRIDDDIIGAVVVQEYNGGNPYTAEEEKILSMISNQIALAIQRKKYSDALSESEEKFRTIFDTAPVGIFQADVNGNIITVNKSLVEILGARSDDEILSMPIHNFYFDREYAEKNIAHVKEFGSIVDTELEWKKLDGEKIWIELSAYFVKTVENTTEHIEGFIKDVTQRKLDQELILQLSSGIEQSPTSVIITDLSGFIEYVNPRFVELTGYSFEEVKGKRPSILKSGKTSDEVYKNLWESISSGRQWRGEFLNKKKNGELFWELAFIFPLYNSAGNISQYLGIKIDITDRKILEGELKKYQEHLEELIEQRTEELRLSEQKFKSLTENSDDLIIRFNIDHEILYMNPAAIKITGFGDDELRGKSIKNFGLDNQIENVWGQALNDVVKKKDKRRIEFLLANEIWIDWVLIPEFDKAGNVIGVFTFGRDITNMKNVENELFRKDKLLQGVAAASNSLFTLEDFDVRIQNAMDVIGKAADVDCVYIFENQIIGEHKNNKLTPIYTWEKSKDFENVKDRTQNGLYKNEEIFSGLVDQLKAGLPIIGSSTDFSPKINELLKEEGIKTLLNVPIEVFGKFWGFIGLNKCTEEKMWSESEVAILTTLASDIGGAIARKIVESQLRSSEERLKILFDYAPEAYFLFDHQGVILDGNKEAEITFGYSKNELIGVNHFQSGLFAEEYLPVINRILSESRKNIPTGPDELEIIRKDGSRASIELNTYPVTIEGKFLLLGAAHDISLRKKAEEEIRKALRHSQDLNQMKSRFVSMVSHEFRTPLSTILSSLELLQFYEAKLSKNDKVSHFNKITKSVDYLTELLDDVITINRADSGKLEAKYGDYDIIDMTEQLITELRGSYVDVPTINFKKSKNKLVAKVDEKLFRQIISNLVSNAIKYTPSDKNIHINLYERNKHFIFEIRDEGVGIPADSQKELFTPFYRASNIGTVPGTGLGLAITKRSVDLLKGQITFSSVENKGTTFTVELPINGVG